MWHQGAYYQSENSKSNIRKSRNFSAFSIFTTIYFNRRISLLGLYQALLSGFKQLNQPILICLFDDTTVEPLYSGHAL